ncbi:MAG: hypothetical protein IJD92_03520 [Bacilli bacterium]|nr:hypothetical protein [Bacilli bacterium]
MKKLLIIFLFMFLFIPNTFALNKNYEDVTANIVGEKIEENKINIYLFYSESCPHCHKEMEFLDNELIKEYKGKINIYKYEVTKNKDNSVLLSTIKEMHKVNSPYVPFTVIGNEYIEGFNDSTKLEIEQIIDNYLQDNLNNNKTFNIPLLGKINAKDASIGLIAVILGFIDGFNPCAMWILLLLINMTIPIQNRKKIFTIGFTFIFTGGLIYFLSMLGISFIIDLSTITIIRNIIAIVAIILGIYNLYIYIKTRKDTGCHVIDKEKRKGIIKKINDIISKKSTILAIIGTIILAVSVNIVELACSLGFPTIFLEILSINNILGLSKIAYLILYIFFYLLDDLIIFIIAVITLKTKGISTKYNKFVNLVGGILMLIMGLLLLFKPEWIMLNF